MRVLTVMISAFIGLFTLSCASLNVQTKKPIKVDINMRVDVYQHVVKDVESLESQVYGEPESKQLNALFSWGYAYAAEYSPEVTNALTRRKRRAGRLEAFLKAGYIGENRDALLEVISKNIPDNLKEEVEGIVKDENADREIVYRATAEKNGITIDEVRKVFFNDHYRRAKEGYWFEVYDKDTGKYRWVRK